MNDSVITEEKLMDIFEENFQRLKIENGHSLSEDVKEAAKEQVRMYWHKLKSIALSVTDTEVPINLPNLRTEKGRAYSIEGIVDIVREGDKIVMYDIKTHEADYVRNHIELYQPQLNVYAFIWENLREETVTETSVIATQLPKDLVDALLSNDSKLIEKASADWNPVIKISHSGDDVQKTISSFSGIVDLIEDHKFLPPEKTVLREKKNGKNVFATDVCRNCDARFSCSSYREYAKEHKSTNWAKFADFYDFEPDELEKEERLESYAKMEDSLSEQMEDLTYQE